MLHSVTNANVRWTVWQMQMHIWLFYVTNVIASARKFPLSDKCKFKYMSTFQRSHHSPPKDSGPRQIGPTNTNTNENANANTFQRSNHSPPKQVTDIVNETCWAVCVYKLVCVCTNVCHLVQTEIATLLNYLINMVLQSIFTIFWQIQIHNFLADVCMLELRRTNIHLPELQKRADRADQSVLFFLAGANFWEKHAKNC